MSPTSSWPPWTNQPIVLYHGTVGSYAANILRNGIDVTRGAPIRDFGRGSYTTTLLSQARGRADMVGASRNGSPAIVKMTLDRTALGSLIALTFLRGSLDVVDYWSFVAHCRAGFAGDPQTNPGYDVVHGPVARTWWGPDRSSIYRDNEQVSFHSIRAQALLRNSSFCKIEVIE